MGTVSGGKRPLVIAVDGPAASGKGTIARALARHYGLPHMDTGLLYRAVARLNAALGVKCRRGDVNGKTFRGGGLLSG